MPVGRSPEKSRLPDWFQGDDFDELRPVKYSNPTRLLKVCFHAWSRKARKWISGSRGVDRLISTTVAPIANLSKTGPGVKEAAITDLGYPPREMGDAAILSAFFGSSTSDNLASATATFVGPCRWRSPMRIATATFVIFPPARADLRGRMTSVGLIGLTCTLWPLIQRCSGTGWHEGNV